MNFPKYMQYPKYWNVSETGERDSWAIPIADRYNFWLQTGVKGAMATLIVNKYTVELRIHDGSPLQANLREFPSLDAAQNWAIEFGRLMQELDKEGRIPTAELFETFKPVGHTCFKTRRYSSL